MYRLRSLLLDCLFYTLFPVYMLLLMPFSVLMTRDNVEDYVFRPWVTFFASLMRFILGLTYTIEGYEVWAKASAGGPCIIACKHQSLWETFMLPIFFKHFVIVLKKELISVPLFGYYLSRLGSIPLDRSQGLTAIKKLIRLGKAASAQGLHIFIFPEGTRSAPGEQPPLNPGIAALYDTLKLPVVPVALNSGIFWGRRRFFKKPGTITVKFLPAIEPGLDKTTFLETLHRAMNTPLDN
jgi:1-acyl-sn-glycerol-3-phosphate acyltransferase